jgi:hypothetical protein
VVNKDKIVLPIDYFVIRELSFGYFTLNTKQEALNKACLIANEPQILVNKFSR